LDPASSTRSAYALLERLIPGYGDDFIFQHIPAVNGKDVFEIESLQGALGKIIIRGNSGVSMASGLNWYLKHFCRSHISLNHHRLKLPRPLPQVKKPVRNISPFKYRNFFNYCTFGYTMPWWDWRQWQRMIDYMALNGINMPLAITGHEAVWYRVFKELGLKEKQVADFFTGPAYLPWGWMGNIDGLAGPLPKSWIESHRKLGQQIVTRQRELGMTPILQGFTGHIPAALKEVFPGASMHRTTSWAGMPGTWFLDPLDPLFERIGKSFIEIQTRLYGSDHLYIADCFNEINPPTDDPAFIARMGKGVFNTMQAADPEAVWVFQGWFLHFQADFWKEPQVKALLGAVPDDRMLGLDLWGESQPVWTKTDAFYGKPWVWNVLLNLAQQVNISGDLETMQQKLAEAMLKNGKKHNPDRLCGIGMMMEGFGYNPVVQEFILEKAWQPQPVNLRKWLAAYAERRYGSTDPKLRQAWYLLLRGPYQREIINGFESIICSTPRLSRFKPVPADSFGVGYDAVFTAKACKLLLDCSEQLKDVPTYRFDLVHVTREMLSNLARRFNADIAREFYNKNLAELNRAGERFLQLIRDMDLLLGTNEHFLLGKWIADARTWGKSKEEKDYYEWNARSIVTMWEPALKSRLRDYAAKEWNGLLKGFYLPRWQLFLDRLRVSLKTGDRFNKRRFFNDLKTRELQWLRSRESYPSIPAGNSIETSRRLYKKYIGFYKTAPAASLKP
jgi:alpha-N-acetylglucosaminidase